MKRVLLLTFMVLGAVFSALAQGRMVSGRITDAAGEGLPGVAVIVKGTSKGTVADMDGAYKIEVAQGATLVYQFIGYTAKEVAVGNQSVINVTLAEEAEQLDEVQIVGYAKKDEASSVPTIKDVTTVVTPNIANALQGQASGVQINASSGQPGAKPNIRVRGTSSINAGSDPLYVIDGVVINSEDIVGAAQQTQRDPLSSINPSDIENITVLKDAAASALYGARAANGVIVVTTKRGKSGKSRINFDTRHGVSQVNRGNFEVMNAQQYMEFHKNPLASYDPKKEWDGVTDTDWSDHAFRTGSMHSYDVSASGGNENTKFFASGGYFTQEGILVGSSMERYAARLNVDHNIGKRVTISLNSSLSHVDQDDAGDGALFSSPLSAVYMYRPIDNPFDANGNPKPLLLSNGVNKANFLFDIDKNYRRTRSTSGNLDGKIVASITDDLTFKHTSSYRFELAQYDQFRHKDTYDGRNYGGYSLSAYNLASTYTSTSLLTYERAFGDHNISALLGHEYQANFIEGISGAATGLPEGLPSLSNGAKPMGVTGERTGYLFNSILSQVAYNYAGKYYATASYRRDGSSRFGSESRYGNFWSLSGAWILSKEDFLAGNEYITNLKLRTAYGVTGNANIGNFMARGLFSYDKYDGLNAAYYSNIANPLLTWETRNKFDVGLDAELMNRVRLGVTYYIDGTRDMLMQKPISAANGFNSMMVNIGAMDNKGVELELGVDVMKRKDFSWKINGNVAFNKNIVKDLGGLDEMVPADYPSQQIIRTGKSYRLWYMQEWAGANPNNGNPSWYINQELAPEVIAAGKAAGTIYERDGRLATSSYGQAARVEMGTGIPKFTGGFNTDFAYKGFDLSVFFTFAGGHKIYNGVLRNSLGFDGTSDRNLTPDALNDRWQQPGDIAENPRYGAKGGNSNSTRFLEKGDYLSLRNIMLGYNLPSKLLSKTKFIEGVRVYASAQNLFTWTAYSGFTPVTVDAGGYNFYEYPEGRMFTLGVNVKL